MSENGAYRKDCNQGITRYEFKNAISSTDDDTVTGTIIKSFMYKIVDKGYDLDRQVTPADFESAVGETCLDILVKVPFVD